MHEIYYPIADHITQWYGPGNYTMPGIDKLLLHTTEGTGWPTYDGGAKAPTLTFHPVQRVIRQHFPLNGSARALRDPSDTPVRENRDNVVQVEIIGFAKDSPFWDQWILNAIAELYAFLAKEWGTPVRNGVVWVPPTPWGTDSQRLTSAQYDAYVGLLGHEHASGNDHRDPGKPDVNAIITRTKTKLEIPNMADPISFSTGVPGAADDPDGTSVNVYEALLRGNFSYYNRLEIYKQLAALDKRLDAIEAKLP